MTIKLTVVRELVTEGENADKTSPQAAAIVAAILAKVGVGVAIDRADIVAELESSGALNTRQDVGRVISYYQPRLQELGVLEITKEAKPEGEKPAKKTRTKKGGDEPAKAEAPAEAAAS
jgi:hypothetical protein